MITQNNWSPVIMTLIHTSYVYRFLINVKSIHQGQLVKNDRMKNKKNEHHNKV